MKQILAPIELIKSLCKKQRFDNAEQYRKSSLSFVLPVEDGMLLYQTLTGEMLLLTGEEYDSIETSERLKADLVERYFWVPLPFDEIKHVDQIKNILKLVQKKRQSIRTFIIFTTLDCNARCFYCFEKGRERFSMSEKTAHDIAKYINRVSKGEKVKFRWFGGEPLVNQKSIDIITSDLKKRGQDFSSYMVSNGYLFDQETVQKAKLEWDLQEVQITLDGTEPVYNRTKAYPDAEGSPFQRVLHNIELLLKAGVRVVVRMNMHRGNADDLRKLSKELSERFHAEERFYAYVALLRNEQGGYISMDEREALAAYRKLDAFLIEKGLRKSTRLNRTIKMNYCMADNDGSIVILPNGNLGECEHFSESELIGSIYSDERDKKLMAAWKEPVERVEECHTCPHYPQCNKIKKCPYIIDSCNEVYRQIKTNTLQEAVYRAYHDIIAGKTSDMDNLASMEDIEDC